MSLAVTVLSSTKSEAIVKDTGGHQLHQVQPVERRSETTFSPYDAEGGRGDRDVGVNNHKLASFAHRYKATDRLIRDSGEMKGRVLPPSLTKWSAITVSRDVFAGL
ncbi:hypothetical protein NKH10_28735 [Mesorhizobium sp. M1340]|uniref:hypothetical protein n=1 Tax=Mesorhizobium sp. M1340 TaxID=2957087 RepID=UPI00333C2032